ncbi:hypothetical protein NM688_g5600 [Phlebia brevispora]|uniref:Uncharacterized protein n=1 Tax=Phlebia brevispora TaxID=194682 RepID=A0ACC1SSK6_9APHY|nr:hypothetical protein NM688_g5600 [Phlebia brevispora]
MGQTSDVGGTPGQAAGRVTSFWWFGAIFFVFVHSGALAGLYYYPFSSTSWKTLLLTFVMYQGGMLGVTMGYHRLYSHRAFKAGPVVSVVIAFFGASATQGSARWWALRHRLHHRYIDDPVHDPYAASLGLLWSHLGWLFYRTQYERMNLIDTTDLDKDVVARLQHKYFVPLTFFAAFAVPPLVGQLWGDALGAFIWAGIIKCVLVWHCTFFINSAAHYHGVQPYSDENTSRGNFILAVLTCGEGNHNFHTFPQDFRSGPTALEWDPPKWILLVLHRFGLVTNLRRARPEDMDEAKLHMNLKAHVRPEVLQKLYAEGTDEHPSWTIQKAQEYATSAARCLIVIDGYVVDATAYLKDHPGGGAIIRKYALRKTQDNAKEQNRSDANPELWKQATWAFQGGINTHSRTAKRRLREFIIAKVAED